jgi:uncharacterized protein (DUF1697 family)
VEGRRLRRGYFHLWDVVFVRKPLTVKKAFAVVEIRESVDRAWPGRGVLYFSRLVAKATSSRLNKVASLPEYKNMTIRSWSTTTKLLAPMECRPASLMRPSADRSYRAVPA